MHVQPGRAYQWRVDEGVGHGGHAPAADVDVCADLQVVELHLYLGQLHTSPTGCTHTFKVVNDSTHDGR